MEIIRFRKPATYIGVKQQKHYQLERNSHSIGVSPVRGHLVSGNLGIRELHEAKDRPLIMARLS
jgi:hypothetical protein